MKFTAKQLKTIKSALSDAMDLCTQELDRGADYEGGDIDPTSVEALRADYEALLFAIAPPRDLLRTTDDRSPPGTERDGKA